MPEVPVTLEDVIIIGYRPPTGTAGGGGGGSEWTEPAISRGEALAVLDQVYSPSCAQETTAEARNDRAFISDREGNDHASGYVPPESPNSGVTIGIGVDLGQRNVQDLRNLRLSQPLINILTPYLGLKGQNAVNYLATHPLALTANARASLNFAVHRQIYEQLSAAYDAGSDFSFWRLPGAIQTVLCSVALQYGPNLPSAAPVFWGAMTQGRWQDAANELKNFGDAYNTRRNLEAGVLQAAIDTGQVPSRC